MDEELKAVRRRHTAASATERVINKMKLQNDRGLKKSMRDEENARTAQMHRGRSLAILLNEMRSVDTGKTPLKKEIKAKLKTWGLKPKNLSDTALRLAHGKISVFLRQRFINKEGKTPTAEKKFVEFWRDNTRLEIHDNIWIGNHQVDAVVIGFRSNKSIGTLFEIDGPIHTGEMKQGKDKVAMKFIEKFLKTPVQRIPNHDVTWPRVKAISDDLSTRRQTDYRSIQRWWAKVSIATLAFGGAKLATSDQQALQKIINDLMGLTSAQIAELISLTKLKNTTRFDFGAEK